MINPNRNIPPKAAVIHGILPRMVDGKPTLEEILPSFLEFIGSSILVAHHAWLDMNFLNREMVRLYHISIQNPVLDTAILDQALRPLKGSASSDPVKMSSLPALADRYHVHIEGHHSSFGDALTTAQIFQQMIRQGQKQGILSLKDLFRKAYQPLGFNPQEMSSM
jgi:DNA polymerase-3 subunit epsilon